MRIATWNVWNSPERQRIRLEAAVEVLRTLAADVVALQEVPIGFPHPGEDVARYLADRCGFAHAACVPYPDDAAEGVALLSNQPMAGVETGRDSGFASLRNCGIRAVVSDGQVEVGITNVHLDYRSIRTRESQIVDVLAWIETRHAPHRYEVLCGDFNCLPDSSVYRYLAGQQSLQESDTPPWHDVARLVAGRAGTVPGPTLDFWTNPRWHDVPALDMPARVDWVLLRDGFDRGLPNPAVLAVDRFGMVPAGPRDTVASDHYGVAADIDFPDVSQA